MSAKTIDVEVDILQFEKDIVEPVMNSLPVRKNPSIQDFESGLFALQETSKFENSFADVIGFPQNQGVPWSEQLSNSTTMFINLRWYLISNFRQFLNELYAEIGLVQTICDVPVDDALRGGIEVKSSQLDGEEVKKLLSHMDHCDDINTAGQGGKWNRLFGGAGIMVLVGDQDPTTPLDIEAIGPDSDVNFRAVDMWELYWDLQNTQGFDPAVQSYKFEYYSYYGEQVHKSRVFTLTGITPPSFIRPRLRGWGLSVVETLVRSINQYLKANDLTFEVLDEFKLDVYKIKDLASIMMGGPDSEAVVQRRVRMMNWLKNYQNAIVMDSLDDYDHKQLSFSGLAEAQSGIRMQVASDMRMPQTKLFGLSATGFNSGEDEIEVYNSMVESQVRNKLKYPILKIVEIRCQELFGFVPDDLMISFKPLREMSAEQQETVKTQKFARLMQAYQSGAITHRFFVEASNQGNLFDVEIGEEDILDGFMSDNIGDIDGSQDDEEGSGADQPVSEGTPKERKRLSGKNPSQGKPKAAGSDKQRIVRDPKESKVKNSAAFDFASYRADGGDGWIDARRERFFDHPKDVGLWSKAEEIAKRAGHDKWQFKVWIYKKKGGQF